MFNYKNINITFLYGQQTLHVYLNWSVNVNTSLKTGYITAYNVIETIEFVSASFFISSIVILNGGPPQVKMGSWATRFTPFSQAHYIVWKEYIQLMDIYQKVLFSLITIHFMTFFSSFNRLKIHNVYLKTVLLNRKMR